MFLPCLVLISVGLALLAVGGTRPLLIASALIFGVGFGTAYPVYVGYVMRDVSAARRGAAFGAILAAFDTGIGTGSTSIGWMIQHYGFRSAFGRGRDAVGARPALLPRRRSAAQGDRPIGYRVARRLPAEAGSY